MFFCFPILFTHHHMTHRLCPRKQVHLSSGRLWHCNGTTEGVSLSPTIIHHRVLCQLWAPRPFQFTFLIQRDAKKAARKHLLTWTGRHYSNEGAGWMSIYLYWAPAVRPVQTANNCFVWCSHHFLPPLASYSSRQPVRGLWTYCAHPSISGNVWRETEFNIFRIKSRHTPWRMKKINVNHQMFSKSQCMM